MMDSRKIRKNTFLPSRGFPPSSDVFPPKEMRKKNMSEIRIVVEIASSFLHIRSSKVKKRCYTGFMRNLATLYKDVSLNEAFKFPVCFKLTVFLDYLSLFCKFFVYDI